MIAKCLVVLAIVAQINGSVCNSRPVAVTGCQRVNNVVVSGCQRANNVVVSNAATATCNNNNNGMGVQTGRSGEAAVITRNVVVKGKYPIALTNCGPTPDKQVPVVTTHVKTPVEVKPTVRLPCHIPAPRVVSHTCTCYKTVMRPRVHEQIISVPSVQRYIETTHKPVVENIHYEACPTNCNDNANNGQFFFTNVGQNGQCGQCKSAQTLQTVQVPQCDSLQSVQTVPVQQVQSVQVPEVNTVQVPQCQNVQTVQLPQFQTVQSVHVPQCQTVQTVQVPQCQNVQTVQSVHVPQCQNVQAVRVPEIHAVPVQTVQLPEVQGCQVQQFPSLSGQGNCGCSFSS